MRHRELWIGLAVCAMIAASACAKIAGLEPVDYVDEIPDGSAARDATSDGPAAIDAQIIDAAADALPRDAGGDTMLPGPVMTTVGAPGNTFAIDTTEVSFGQYRAFVTAVAGDTGAQPPICAFNRSLGPEVIGADEEPVVGVDWCDARAYCAWAGKRLCGRVVAGGDAGPLAIAEIGSPTVAQFTIACSGAGVTQWPYGNAEVPGNCNVGDGGIGKRAPIATFPRCVGGYPGIYDMVGNVFEWIDLCFPEDGGAEMCILQGAGYATAESSDCTRAFSGPIDFVVPDIGFRCCSK